VNVNQYSTAVELPARIIHRRYARFQGLASPLGEKFLPALFSAEPVVEGDAGQRDARSVAVAPRGGEQRVARPCAVPAGPCAGVQPKEACR
jgi:hypothetical protein